MVVDGVAVKYSRYNAIASFLLTFSGLGRAMTHPRFASSRYSILLTHRYFRLLSFSSKRRKSLLYSSLSVYSSVRIIVSFVSFNVKRNGCKPMVARTDN